MKKAEMTEKDWVKVDMLVCLRTLRNKLNGKYDIVLSDFVCEYDDADPDVVDLDSVLVGVLFTDFARDISPDFAGGLNFDFVKASGINLEDYNVIVKYADVVGRELYDGERLVSYSLRSVRLLRYLILNLNSQNKKGLHPSFK